VTLLMPGSVSCAKGEQESNATGKTSAPGEAEARKLRSETRLRAEGVPVLDSLPTIESEAEARFRTIQAVADRLLALTLVAIKAEELLSGETAGHVRDTIDAAIIERKAQRLFTPKESGFIRTLRPERRDQIKFQWRFEAAWVLAWALRWIDGPLSPPRQPCDGPLLSGIVYDQLNLAARGLRPFGEILDEADLVYRYAWAADEARIGGRAFPAGLNPDVVVERHQALNWLIGYQGQDWDDVTTDT
jgi:hypothetical protein